MRYSRTTNKVEMNIVGDLEVTNAVESAKNAFSEVGMSLLDDTVSSANGKKRRAPGAQSGKPKKQRCPRNIFS